jgi:hypothetical protein
VPLISFGKILETENRRLSVIISRIGRLTPTRRLPYSAFRFVKPAGRLPNVMYLIIFDRELADNVIQERYTAERPHFLNKSFKPVLNQAVLTSVQEICGSPDQAQVGRTTNV